MLLLDFLEQNDIALPPFKVVTNDNNDDRDRTLRSILTYNERKYDVDCKERKYDKRYHMHVDGLGDFTFDENSKKLLYATKPYDTLLLKKMTNIVDVWEKQFSNF